MWLVVLLWHICFNCVHTEEAVYIQKTQHAFTEETVHLKCNGVQQLRHAMWFYKMSNNQELQYSEGLTLAFTLNEAIKQRLNVSYNNNTLILTIFNATLNDCGKYRCLFDQQRVSSDAITLIVNDPPSLSMHYRNQTISCNVSENSNTIISTVFKWEHRTIYNEHIRYINNSYSGVLSLADNQTKILLYLYNGKYICTAEITVQNYQKLWIQTSETLVEMQGPPVCVKDGPTKNVFFSEGNVAATLKFFSLPKYLDIVWSIDGVSKILDQQKYDVVVKKHNESIWAFNVLVKINVYLTKLIIYNLTEDDFGNYTARIYNTDGQCECVTELRYQDYINVVGIKTDVETVCDQIRPEDVFSYKKIITHGIVAIVMIIFFCLVLLCKFYIQRRRQHAKLNTNVQNIITPVSEFDMQQIRNSYDSINEENMIEMSSPLQSLPAQYISVYTLEESTNGHEMENTSEHHTVDHEGIILSRRDENTETSSDDSVAHEVNNYLNPYQSMRSSMLDIHNYSDVIYPVSEENASAEQSADASGKYITTTFHMISQTETFETDENAETSDDSVSQETNNYLNPYQPLRNSMLDIHNYSGVIYPVRDENVPTENLDDASGKYPTRTLHKINQTATSETDEITTNDFVNPNTNSQGNEITKYESINQTTATKSDKITINNSVNQATATTCDDINTNESVNQNVAAEILEITNQQPVNQVAPAKDDDITITESVNQTTTTKDGE